MGTTVRVLDEALIDQIAAGVVVERPAHVVKELLENAIDAQASSISVWIEDGGRRQIRVTDNGIGMSPGDARLCIERHATSKIRSFDDLVRVRSLGFRGEALPSIAAVSRMRITTRPAADPVGTAVQIAGGELGPMEPHGGPPGTTVDVADLFYNVPARKKFLRARQTESAKIFETCQRLALIHPALRLLVHSEGRRVREYLPVQSLVERAQQAFGDIPLIGIHSEREGIRIDAALSRSTQSQVGTRQLFLYVNDRPVLDRRLARAIAFAYGSGLEPGRYPRGVLAIRMPSEDVDVNAHPQKTEVRFARSAWLFDLVTRMLAGRIPEEANGSHFWQARLGAAGPTVPLQQSTDPGPSRAAGHAAESPSDYSAPLASGSRLLAQLRHRYLLVESEDALYVLDRQIAEESVRKDQLRDALTANAGHLRRRVLLFPDRLELDQDSRDILDEHESALSKLGFECSALGEQSCAIRSVPTLAGHVGGATLLRAVLLAMRGAGGDPVRAGLDAIASAAATRNGEPCPDAQAQEVVAGLRLDDPAHLRAVVERVELQGPRTR